MNLADLLALGIAARLDDDGGLLLDAPRRALTPELIECIRQSKPGLIAELGSAREFGELGELHLVCMDPSGEADTQPTDTAPPVRASRWLVHYVDRDPVQVVCWPDETHAEILAGYTDAIAAEPYTPDIRQPSTTLTTEEETAVRAWLALIDETDPTTIADVIERCRLDDKARSYFTWRAGLALSEPDPFPDDRRTCDQCANLAGRRCMAAKRGEIAASRSYEPIRDQPRRCEGYAPGPNDSDRRHGRERWPSPIETRQTDRRTKT